MYHRTDCHYPLGRYRAQPTPDPHLRVSDADRHAVGDRLSRHFADGRLDQTEFDLRLTQANGAVTRGDLDGLFDDLPPFPDEATVPRRRRRHLVPLVVAVILVAIAMESAVSLLRVPWLLAIVVGVLLWHRFGRHDHDGRASSDYSR